MSIIDFPKEIMIEATNYCNNKCFFCASPVSNRARGYIDTDHAIRLIDEAYDMGCRKISFHGMGEPFLHTDLHLFVAKAKKAGYDYIYLDTNGTIARKDRFEKILDAGLDSLKFSIHAAKAETFYKITKNDSFEKVKENAKYICEYIKRNQLKCKTIAYCAVSRINETETELFREIWGGYFSEIWIRPIHNGSGVRPENEKYVSEDKKEEFVARQGLPCPELYNRMIINWEGKAIGCCTDWTGSLIYGDTYVSSLKELWNCEKMSELRGKHASRESLPEICMSCMGYTRS